jgi:phage shock protein C
VGRQVAGVCLGVAEYFDLDVILVRLIWLLCAIFGGFGFIAYLVAWIVMPNDSYLLPASQTNTASGHPAT